MREAEAGELLIGIDLGGTNLRVAAVDRAGSVHASRHTPAGADEGPVRIQERIAGTVAEVIEETGHGGAGVRGVAMAAPGIISAAAGTVVASPNLPGWRDVPLRKVLEEATSLPVILENDANAAAYGEYWIGSARTARALVMLTLGTGVGGGIVLDGRLWRGVDGMAGEVGHVSVEPAGRPCPCGNRGCLEQYASATAVLRRFRELREEAGRPAGEETAADVCRLAIGGDPEACRSFEEAGRALGAAVAALVNIFNPDAVVFGGGVLPAWDLFLPALRAELFSRAFQPPAERAAILPAALGVDAGCIGAAGLLWQALEGGGAGAARG